MYRYYNIKKPYNNKYKYKYTYSMKHIHVTYIVCIAQVHVLIYSKLSKCLDMVAYTLYVGWPAKNGHKYNIILMTLCLILL